jgi:hypothetical protein
MTCRRKHRYVSCICDAHRSTSRPPTFLRPHIISVCHRCRAEFLIRKRTGSIFPWLNNSKMGRMIHRSTCENALQAMNYGNALMDDAYSQYMGTPPALPTYPSNSGVPVNKGEVKYLHSSVGHLCPGRFSNAVNTMTWETFTTTLHSA